jgi:hypothetical protein
MSTTTSLHVDHRSIHGVRIRFAASGGTNGPTLLLTSPWPERLASHSWLGAGGVAAHPGARPGDDGDLAVEVVGGVRRFA